jgi:hypothetical protein
VILTIAPCTDTRILFSDRPVPIASFFERSIFVGTRGSRMKRRCVASRNRVIQPIGKAILFSAAWMQTLKGHPQPFDFESELSGHESG